jgi:phosphoglycolate phosphatase
MLGPPFTKSLPRYVAPELVDPVIATYRGYYREGGMFDAAVYDGIPELLNMLRDAGVTLAVATSKIEAFARPILQKLGLADYFVTIGGDDFQASRDSKALVVGEVLTRLGSPDPTSVLMVGDRIHDVDGSAQHGIACIGAGWGYGSPAELAGAVQWYPTPREMLRALRG